MKITFNIAYRTAFGEDLVLNVLTEEKVSAFPMMTLDGEHWTRILSGKTAEKLTAATDYYYSVRRDGVEARREWQTQPHRLELSAQKAGAYTVYDHWIDIPEDAYLYSSAFTDCVNGMTPARTQKTSFDRTVRLKVRAPQLRKGQRLAVTGSAKCLGCWQPTKAKAMCQHHYNEWLVDLNAADFPDGTVEFKFVALHDKQDVSPLWETGANRIVHVPAMPSGEVTVYELDQAFFAMANRKLAGTLVPVFSLRSKDSFGVGDFGDLRKMVGFIAQTRQSVLQILPVNDTTTTHTWTDSYPYSCISIFAIHPQYADLTALPALKDEEKRRHFETLREKLNALPQIDYEQVNAAKTAYLKELYAQEGQRALSSAAFKQFFKEEEQWLVPYARYCVLREENGTADFSLWKGHERWQETERKALSNPRAKAFKEAAFYYFVQYILSRQLKDVHREAREKGVILKGDIPIGVNRHGCDVWMEPDYFNMNGQAGAPPDDFSVNGQNWGFPTYNWDAMIQDGCRWWVRRFQNMAKYFDAYRIDHVLGFFRIWEIPIHSVHGLLGQFSPALAMTREEIEAYGLKWQEDLFTRPFIADWVLARMFGDKAGVIKEEFLRHTHDDMWEMRPEYDTQRKVEAYFATGDFARRHPDMTADHVRDGLYALISDVLFLRDRKDKNKFHPRISVQFDFIYETLYDSDKTAFNRLYNDYYYRRNNQFWYREAMKKLPRLVQATRMLVCAEDLGMVTDCVSWVMNELKILSLELQSMPKDPKVRFGHLSQNPYRSVCTISSHDMPTLRQWWDEDEARTQDYYNTMLYRGGAAPHPLPGWLARDIISRHLTSPSMLCILSIQDWLAIDEDLRLPDADAERINIPANPKHYWRYRMHLNIEDLAADRDFSDNIKGLILDSGRK